MKKILFKRGYLVGPEAVRQQDLLIDGDRISLSTAASAAEVQDITGKYVVPGFVDIHFHGFRLFELTSGLFDARTGRFDDSQPAYNQGLLGLQRLLPGFGVTGAYLGTLASEVPNLKRCFRFLREFIETAGGEVRGTRFHGGLLEGSFLNPSMCGAQNPKYAFKPARATFDSIDDQGVIKLANVVPDFGRASLDLTRHLAERGVIVGAGHTDATAQQVKEAAEAGLKYIIHFTNGPTGGSYKPFEGGGAVEGTLTCDDLYAEIIADGYHVNPAYVLDIIERKGADRIIGVTDAIYVSGSTLEEIDIAGIKGRVSEDGRYFYVLGKKNTLFSSNLTMNRAFANFLNWLTAGSAGIWHRKHRALSLEEALVRTARICSTNACELTGLRRQGYGAVEEGAKADLCVLDIQGDAGRYTVGVHGTWIDGRQFFAAQSGGR